jgi:ABC-type transporter Mla subunit MlaD
VSDLEFIEQIIWSSDEMTQGAILLVLGAATLAALTVYFPLLVRLGRLYSLERKLRRQSRDWDESGVHDGHELLRHTMQSSPVDDAFEEFVRRWTASQLGDSQNRAPIRLVDVFDDRPLLPHGPRRSLLPVLPGLFLGLGVFAALGGLIPTLSSQPTEMLDGIALQLQSAGPAAQIGLALRATAWGFLCAIGASLGGRLIEGSFHARASGLDKIVEHAYGSVSPGELAEITRQTQQQSVDTLGRELTRFAHELNERLDRGLQRIEQSTARSASLVSQEQRGALHTVVQELSLSMRQGVDHHLGELRGALQQAIDHQGSVTGALAETFERMSENSKSQDRVARTLTESAVAVEEAARIMSGSAEGMAPVLEHLGTTSRALADTAEQIGDTQQVVARTAEGVRTSLEHAASGVDDQRQFIERSLAEIRRTLVGLGDGLGESLQRSLREVDGVLGSTVGLLRETLTESNETIDRLAAPIRAAEGSTRETHVALDRVRMEVEALGQWMTMAAKPLRSGLVDVDGRAEEMTRAIIDFTNQARQIDKTMESLREEIREESRRLQGTGGDLGRRLTKASDAVQMLESATSDAARRASPDASTSPTPRDSGERNWSPTATAPPTSPPTSPPTQTSGRSSLPSLSSLSSASEPPPPPSSRFAPTAQSDDTTSVRTPVSDVVNGANGSDESALDSTGRDLGLSGFRMGTPRAQGPDPYARFDSVAAPPSNLRHLPTPDRELGDNLKLSGLLGPSGPDSESTEEEEDDSTGAEDAESSSRAPDEAK